MRAQTVEVKSSTGRVLCCTVFRPGGMQKLLAKGHVISRRRCSRARVRGHGVHLGYRAGRGQEVGEDDRAVCQVASEMGCGSFEIRLAAGGRANLLATENCCVLVDDELLRQINCTASVVIATSLNFSYAVAGQRIATVKSAPFAVGQRAVGSGHQYHQGCGADFAGASAARSQYRRSLHRPNQRGAGSAAF